MICNNLYHTNKSENLSQLLFSNFSIKDQDGRFFEYFSSVHVSHVGSAPGETDEADGNFNYRIHGVSMWKCGLPPPRFNKVTTEEQERLFE